MPSDFRPLDAEGRAGMKRWLDNWRIVGPLLEQERAERVARMTDEEARREARDLEALWRPSDIDDLGAELVTHQRWFMRAARVAGR